MTNVPAAIRAMPLDFVDLGGRQQLPEPTLINARVALMKLGVNLRYDVFRDRRYSGERMLTGVDGQITDEAITDLRMMIRRAFDFDPGKNNTWDAVNHACVENSFNSVLDYLDPLVWDGVERLDTWM